YPLSLHAALPISPVDAASHGAPPPPPHGFERVAHPPDRRARPLASQAVQRHCPPGPPQHPRGPPPRSRRPRGGADPPRQDPRQRRRPLPGPVLLGPRDRKSTRLNSSHVKISYAVFCLKKKHQA